MRNRYWSLLRIESWNLFKKINKSKKTLVEKVKSCLFCIRPIYVDMKTKKENSVMMSAYITGPWAFGAAQASEYDLLFHNDGKPSANKSDSCYCLKPW